MKNDMVDFIVRCMECQRLKVEKHLAGFLQPLPIPERKWEMITIDFITKFPKTTRQHDSIMVVVENLTKTTHFILVKLAHKAMNREDIFFVC
jgi:hypothetical protein